MLPVIDVREHFLHEVFRKILNNQCSTLNFQRKRNNNQWVNSQGSAYRRRYLTGLIFLAMEQKKYDLEDRFVAYTCSMIDIVEALPITRAGNYIASQLVRSCHSPTFNYGEAQAAESRNDFIHKMGVILKELKECRIILKIILKKKMLKPEGKAGSTYKETEELIAIIGKSISTAQKNKQNSLQT